MLIKIKVKLFKQVLFKEFIDILIPFQSNFNFNCCFGKLFTKFTEQASWDDWACWVWNRNDRSCSFTLTKKSDFSKHRSRYHSFKFMQLSLFIHNVDPQMTDCKEIETFGYWALSDNKVFWLENSNFHVSIDESHHIYLNVCLKTSKSVIHGSLKHIFNDFLLN